MISNLNKYYVLVQISAKKKRSLLVTEQVSVLEDLSLVLFVKCIRDGEEVEEGIKGALLFESDGSTLIFFSGKVGDNEGPNGRFFIDIDAFVSLCRTAFGISTSSEISK